MFFHQLLACGQWVSLSVCHIPPGLDGPWHGGHGAQGRTQRLGMKSGVKEEAGAERSPHTGTPAPGLVVFYFPSVKPTIFLSFLLLLLLLWTILPLCFLLFLLHPLFRSLFLLSRCVRLSSLPFSFFMSMLLLFPSFLPFDFLLFTSRSFCECLSLFSVNASNSSCFSLSQCLAISLFCQCLLPHSYSWSFLLSSTDLWPNQTAELIQRAHTVRKIRSGP